MFEEYLKRIAKLAKSGEATEGSYYSSLEWLLESLGKASGKPATTATSLTKQTEAGFPDIKVKVGKQRTVGYVEVKDPRRVSNLDRLPPDDKKRFDKYLDSFHNIILTNTVDFYLYHNGELIERAPISDPPDAYGRVSKYEPAKVDDLEKLFFKFFAYSLPTKFSAETLARELAKRTRLLRDNVIAEELQEQADHAGGDILGFFQAFQQTLISTLTMEEFADLFAQTITYGLLAAKYRTKPGEEFDRRLAVHYIPKTIGVLRDVFRYISSGDIPRQMEWTIDDVAEVLTVADVHGIFEEYFKKGLGRDPLFFFYETFLAEYDPEEKEQRGVFYTPEPVVGYIVRSVNRLMKDTFSKARGLATDDVTVLDPAAGTLTFLAIATQVALKEYVDIHGGGAKHGFIRNVILENYYAFELMMAPYTIGHLKMAFLLEELGYNLEKDERLKFYLTNTLEMTAEDADEVKPLFDPVIKSITEESEKSAKVKRDQPIIVVLGNPPYSAESANPSKEKTMVEAGQEYVPAGSKPEVVKDDVTGEFVPRQKLVRAKKRKEVWVKNWIGQQIDTYKIDEGKWLEEKTSKWLQDDYVKFIRFAQWKIDQLGEGVLAFITNHGFIDNPTFRGMRQSLLSSFNEVYILDLHGSMRKKEVCPDGTKDENVFDIRNGVAISIFVKREDAEESPQVFHHDLWGLRQKKYDWLIDNDIRTTGWAEVKSVSPRYYFVPRDISNEDKWLKCWNVEDVFPLHGAGMTTARDSFVMDFDRDVLLSRIRRFKDSDEKDDGLHRIFGVKRKQGWSIRKAWNSIQALSERDLEALIRPVLFRAFDTRWIFYQDDFVWRTVREVMANLVYTNNIALIAPRQHKNEFGAFVTKTIGCHKTVAANDINYYFPLYLVDEDGKKTPNLDADFVECLSEAYGESVSPEMILEYVYGILYSMKYRDEFGVFLKDNFPRIPFTQSLDLFSKMADLGKQLIDLHLLKSDILDSPVATYECHTSDSRGQKRNLLDSTPLEEVQVRAGDDNLDAIEKVDYFPDSKRVWINDLNYFDGIEPEVWKYFVGGHQVCDKWLRERKKGKRVLEVPYEAETYCRIVTAIHHTIKLQREIDRLFRKIDKGPLVEPQE